MDLSAIIGIFRGLFQEKFWGRGLGVQRTALPYFGSFDGRRTTSNRVVPVTGAAYAHHTYTLAADLVN